MEEDVNVIAVIVVMFNSAALLPALLESLPPGLSRLKWNLTLVDNGSSDDSLETARRLAPDARVVATGSNGGYAAGINAGLRELSGDESVLILNPDVRLKAGCVEELVRACEVPGVGIAVPHLENGDGDLILSMRREPTVLRTLADVVFGARRAGRWGSLGEVVADRRLYTSTRLTDWFEGAAMLVTPDCVSATQGWDESFFLYSEETEFALRARDLGFAAVFVPTAQAVHLQGGSSTNPKLWPLVVKNKVRLYHHRHSLAASLAFYAAITIREATRAMLGRETNRAALSVLLSPKRMRERSGPWSIGG